MAQTEPYIALRGLFSLFMFWVFWYFIWKPYAVESFRHKLFSIRSELFIDVAMGRIQLSFSSPEYRRIRSYINHLILEADQLLFAPALISYFLSRLKVIEMPRNVKGAFFLKNVDEATRVRIARLGTKHIKAMEKFLLKTSPTFGLLYLTSRLLRSFFSGKTERTIEQIEAEMLSTHVIKNCNNNKERDVEEAVAAL